MIGQEQVHHPDHSRLEKMYIRIFGMPIVGLRIRARILFSLLPKGRHPDRILDAGSGTGVFAFALARRFPRAQVRGIDKDARAVRAAAQIARMSGMSNIAFRRCPIEQMDEADAFDLVVCFDILEHIEEDLRALRSLFRVTSPGGMLILHVPSLFRRYPVWRKQRNFDVPSHVREGYRRKEIVTRVQEAGFRVTDSGFTYGFWETLANNLSYMITRARMRNRRLYALAFPVLNGMSLLGRGARPESLGAGIFIVAEKAKDHG